jgi:hypothetical protein
MKNNRTQEDTMNPTSRETPGSRSRAVLLRSALAGAIGLGVCAPASAQWIVKDPTNFVENLWNRVETAGARVAAAAEYAKTAQRWNELRVKAMAQINSFGLPSGATLTIVPDNYLVPETCGTGGGLSVGTVFEKFVFKPTGDWKAQQEQICVNIRTMQNRKYNESVRFIGETLPVMQDALDAITTVRQASALLGNISAVDSDSLRTANDIAVKTQEFESRMAAYDAYIQVMEANQMVVAKTALKGDPTTGMIRDLVKTAALKTALEIK